MFDLTGVPFEIPNVFLGLQVVKGVIRVRETSVILEFDVKDAFGGFIRNELREEIISIQQLEKAEWRRGLFRSYIFLKARSMKTFSNIPGSEQAALKLKIRRPYRADAERLYSRLRLIMSDLKLAEMDKLDS